MRMWPAHSSASLSSTLEVRAFVAWTHTHVKADIDWGCMLGEEVLLDEAGNDMSIAGAREM